MWLLIPEFQRLGIWDLLLGWTRKEATDVEPRLALQLVNEAALCVTGVRQARTLAHKGFEVANGLPFLASDQAVHDLLKDRTLADSQDLQVALGRIRRACGHFQGKVLAVDPHLMPSHSKREMVRKKGSPGAQPFKHSQSFFCLDVDTEQPVAFTLASSSKNVTPAALDLLEMTEKVLGPTETAPLILADAQHFSAQLFEQVLRQTPFDLIVPEPRRKIPQEKMTRIDPETFTPHWAGFATAVQPYRFVHSEENFYQIVQRCGEREGEYRFKGFVSTRADNQVQALTVDYPRRWHVEGFFNKSQALGWKRAGTLNLNIRFGKMTLALLAQSGLHQLRSRLGEPYHCWDASNFARNVLAGLDGDLRVHDDTILVTYYNATDPERLQEHFSGLPKKLEREGIDPRIPWLYDFKLDFRFR